FDHPEAITKNWTRFTFENRPDVKPIFDEYREHLTRASHGADPMESTERSHSVGSRRDQTLSDYHPEAQPKDLDGGGSQPIRGSSPESILSVVEGAQDDNTTQCPATNEDEREVTPNDIARNAHALRPNYPVVSTDVSVIIPAYNAARFIREAIE